MAQPVRPADEPDAVRHRARRHGRRSSRRPPRRRRRCSATSTRRWPRSTRWRDPYIQDSITDGKPALDAGIESMPRQRPFLANTEGLMRELQPGVRALRTAAPALSDALGDRHRRCCPRRRRSTSAWSRCCRSCRRSPTTRWSRAASSRPTELVKSARPDARLPRADPDGLQLRDAVLPQHLLAAERGRQQRHLAAVHHRHHAAGPEQRGRPVVGAGQRPDGRTTTCTPTRTRTRPPPGSRRSARPATSRT